jgi:hypothetical protein
VQEILKTMMEEKTMADEKKLEKLQKKLAEQKAKLDDIRKVQSKEKDPDKLVELNRTAASIENVITALEHTYEIASYEPPEPTEAEILLAGVNAYVDAKQEKIQNVQGNIEKALAEQSETDASLEEYAENGYVDEVIKLSKQREGIDEKLKYLKQMKERTEALRTFPEGAIEQEWRKVCQDKQDEWNSLLLRIEILAGEYRKACDELLEMDSLLRNVRSFMQNLGTQEDGETIVLPQVLTVGLDVDPLTISKRDGSKLFEITNNMVFGNHPL